MTPKPVISPQAQRDFVELGDHIARNSVGASLRFAEAFDKSLELLLSFPKIAGVWETDNTKYQDMRCWSVSGFPHHLIFYRAIPGGIEVIRVLHSSRDLDDLFSH